VESLNIFSRQAQDTPKDAASVLVTDLEEMLNVVPGKNNAEIPHPAHIHGYEQSRKIFAPSAFQLHRMPLTGGRIGKNIAKSRKSGILTLR